MAHDQSDLLQGTLDLMILKSLSLEPMHGWGITQRIQQTSRDVFQINQGSLYPALQRLASRGALSAARPAAGGAAEVLEREGLSAGEARGGGARAVGGVERFKDGVRKARGLDSIAGTRLD